MFLERTQDCRLEGIFAEPSSFSTIAATEKMVDEGIVDEGKSVVCLITGSGLKATDALQVLVNKKSVVVGLNLSTKEKILGILSREDTYGYDIRKKIGKTMTRAAIYKHLKVFLEWVLCLRTKGIDESTSVLRSGE